MYRLIAICVCLMVATSQAFGSVWQDGNYARYEKYKRPMFVAQLQTLTETVSPQEILSGEHSFRLDLAIAAEYLSDRRLTRMLREAMAINATNDALAKESQNLEKLYQFMHYDLYRGDHYSIEYHPTVGTMLQVNNMPELQLANSSVGVLLLNGFLGDVPLSSEFRKAMFTSAEAEQELAQEFASLNPDKNRSQQIEAEINKTTVDQQSVALQSNSVDAPSSLLGSRQEPNKPKPDSAKVTTASVQKPKATPPKVQAKIAPANPNPKPAVTKTSPTVTVANTTNSSTRSTPAATSRASSAKPPVATPKLVKSSRVDPGAEKKVAQRATSTNTQPANSIQSSKGIDKEVQVALLEKPKAQADSVDTLPASSAKQASTSQLTGQPLLLAQQSYEAELEREIKVFQTMPYKALSRRMEGNVTVDVAVDKAGRIVNLEVAKASRHNLLNDQALDAVTSAEPFKPIPDELGVEEFTFTVELKYKRLF